MEPQENKDEGKACCGCGKSKCCCKAVMALVLLLVGGAIGFFCGRHCGAKMCPVSPAASAPAAPAPAK